MTLLSREAILAADDLTAEVVAVPEWGGSVRVRTMTAAERDAFEVAVLTAKETTGRVNIRAMLAALTVCDDAGKALFAAEDLTALGAKSAAALDRVFGVASRLNALTEQEVTELGKGSAGAAPGSTPSSSPSGSD